MITSTVLLNCHITFGTFFCIGSNPIRCFRIVVAFLNPFFQITAQNRIVPILAAFKTKYMSAFAYHRSGFHINYFDRIVTID